MHEWPEPDYRITQVYAITGRVLITQRVDATKPRSNYTSLLELTIRENPNCERSAYYYARELTVEERWADAIPALHRYLNLSVGTSKFHIERCHVMRLLDDW